MKLSAILNDLWNDKLTRKMMQHMHRHTV